MSFETLYEFGAFFFSAIMPLRIVEREISLLDLPSTLQLFDNFLRLKRFALFACFSNLFHIMMLRLRGVASFPYKLTSKFERY